jgi:hypothetical protein
MFPMAAVTKPEAMAAGMKAEAMVAEAMVAAVMAAAAMMAEVMAAGTARADAGRHRPRPSLSQSFMDKSGRARENRA